MQHVEWKMTKDHCIRNNNDRIVPWPDHAEHEGCQELCETETRFLCCSVELWGGNFQLSKHSQYKLPSGECLY